MKKLGIILFVMVLAGTAGAANNTAVSSGNWNVGGIWDTIHAPQAGEDVIIPSGITVTNSSPCAAINSLSVAGTLQIASDANALAACLSMTLANGSTLQLRSDSTATFNAPIGMVTAGASASINVNNNGSGLGNTLTLGGGLRVNNTGTETTTINVTGGNGYVLNVPTLTLGSAGSPGPNTILNPTTAGITIGVNVNVAGGQTSTLTLGGTNSGSVVTSFSGAWCQLFKTGSSTWTWNANTAGGPLGNNTGGMDNGTLIVNGNLSFQTGNRFFTLSGGTLCLNSASAFGGLLVIAGGNLDNSSGTNITTSTYNPTMSWNGNINFLGSNGTNSDLNLGTGAVTMNATRTVTVNSNATLTVGGVISGSGFGLTKAGTGTLKLTGVNTYSGVTTVSAGTLILAGNSSCAGATIVTNGTLVGVLGGSCLNSAVTVTNTGVLSISVTNETKQWTCASLALNNGSQLKFSFTVKPSTTLAPLEIKGDFTFNGTPLILVDPTNLMKGRKYPLIVIGGQVPADVPALSLPGMVGVLSWGGDSNKTLSLGIPDAGTVITIR